MRPRTNCTACFDLLAQERDHYYAVDAYVLDLTSAVHPYAGPSLAAHLASHVPVNLLLTGQLLGPMQRPASPSPSALLRKDSQRGMWAW